MNGSLPSAKLLVVLGGLLLHGACMAADPAAVTLGDLVQTYDGAPKIPSVSTDPPGLDIAWNFLDSRLIPAVETVYRNAPETLALSYKSLALASTDTWAVGDQVQLAGSGRQLKSVAAVMVTWAMAADYPTEAAADPAGWRHPIRLTIYRMETGGQLTFINEVIREIFVPWRPLTLPDGSPYPHNGYAFMADFDFPEGVVLPEQPFIMLSFDTQNTGFDPIGVPGPYNKLNVALGNASYIGSNPAPSTILWVRRVSGSVVWNYPASTVGDPMFVVRATEPTPPGSGTPPTNAGTWRAAATINTAGYSGQTVADFTILPAAAGLAFSNLTQVADGNPKEVAVTTSPPGLPVSLTYNGSATPPSALGTYAVAAQIQDSNHIGNGTATLKLGHNLASWLAPWVANGSIGTATGALDDPDGDSIGNLLEYAFALDPGTADHGLPVMGMPQGGLSSNQLSLTYRINTLATDLSFQIESSTNLGSGEFWQPITSQDEILADDGNVRTIRSILNLPANDPRRFARLRVIRAGP